MKKISLLLLICLPLMAMAQQEGRITYKETTKFEIDLPEEAQQYAHLIPTENVSTMELLFNANESLYMEAEIPEESEQTLMEGGMTTVISMGRGASAKTYFNVEENLLVQSQDMMGQPFLITGPLPEMNWKVVPEQKEILGQVCMKAIHTKDSVTHIAWFAPGIPASVGPANWRGLPGAVLEVSMESENTGMTIEATEIVFEDISDKIAKPKKGKKVTQEEFGKIMEAKMKEMGAEQNGDGPAIMIRVERN
ncbi:MAG: GLPGLI family protein [Bacteroidota bacterium]